MNAKGRVQVAKALVAAMAVAGSGPAAAADAELKQALETLQQRKVLFGHQSVGKNILDGVQDLLAQEQASLPVRELGAGPLQPGLTHVRVAENYKPRLKLRSFDEALRAAGGAPDVALVKFCYVDVTEVTDPRALFEDYRKAARELRAKYPQTTFVHVTAPLTTIPAGLKAFVKRQIGRDRNKQENVRREEFNALMRQAYQGREPFFDLAKLESTRPDGTAETYEHDGKEVPAMAAAWTNDGGHLFGEGRKRMARELLLYLASLPARTAAANP